MVASVVDHAIKDFLKATRPMKNLRKLATTVLALLPFSFAMPNAHAAPGAANYPNGTITFVVGATPGGATDIVARVVGQQLSTAWGVPVVVVNKAGAGGEIAASYVKASKPDGQTVLVAPSAFGVLSGLSRHLPYDPLKDFAGIGLMARTPSFLVVPPQRNIKTIAQLRAYALARPDGVVYGSAGTGSTGHLHAAIVANRGGFKSQHAPYRGTPEAVNDVVAGRLDYAFSPGPNALPFAKDGKLVIIATTSALGDQFAPGVQTMTQAGVDGDPGDDWYGALVPAGTPMDIRVKLSSEVARILTLEPVRKSLVAVGGEPVSSTPLEFDAMLKSYITQIRKLGDETGIQLE
jgi:tripartite-type tricarboxylate transporter receptor subunit TctC